MMSSFIQSAHQETTGGRISLRDLSVAFTARRGRPLVAVENANLEVAPGEFVALLGPSGCGKTTVLNAVAGFVPPSAGGVFVDGEQVVSPSRHCGFVFQQNPAFPWMTALDNVAFAPRMQGKANPREIADRFLTQVGLRGFEDAYPGALSGGMRQRVGIARALASNTPILLMDEPFGALDAQTRGLMQEQLLELWERERKTVLFVTHDVDEAIFLAGRVVVMGVKPGHIREEFSVALPRPRHPGLRHTRDYTRIHAEISAVIREESLKSFQEEIHAR
jgi:NitT/TauT family transport system ATP-binding protein